MDSDSNSSPVDGGNAAERQPLLPSPLSVNNHHDVDAAIVVDGSSINTLMKSRMKLGACALNFFLSGIAMAAVGVSIAAHTCTADAR